LLKTVFVNHCQPVCSLVIVRFSRLICFDFIQILLFSQMKGSLFLKNFMLSTKKVVLHQGVLRPGGCTVWEMIHTTKVSFIRFQKSIY